MHHERIEDPIFRRAVDLIDVPWHGTPADWAAHEGKTEVEDYLKGHKTERKNCLKRRCAAILPRFCLETSSNW